MNRAPVWAEANKGIGGYISQIFGPLPIGYVAPHYNFQGSVVYEALFTIAGTGVLFSDSGDSGSLITALDAAGQRTAVGIVVGGMNDGTAVGNKVTLALAIEPIIVAFGVTLVGGHNV